MEVLMEKMAFHMGLHGVVEGLAVNRRWGLGGVRLLGRKMAGHVAQGWVKMIGHYVGSWKMNGRERQEELDRMSPRGPQHVRASSFEAIWACSGGVDGFSVLQVRIRGEFQKRLRQCGELSRPFGEGGPHMGEEAGRPEGGT